jgi:hypothetical protein
MPHIIVVGKNLADGQVELRNRRTGDATPMPVGDVVGAALTALTTA